MAAGRSCDSRVHAGDHRGDRPADGSDNGSRAPRAISRVALGQNMVALRSGPARVPLLAPIVVPHLTASAAL